MNLGEDFDFDLQEVEVMNLLGEPEYISEKEMSFWCPKCDPPHHKPKLFVNRKTFQCHCFVCGFKAHNVSHLAFKLNKKTRYSKRGGINNFKVAIQEVFGGSHKEEALKLPNGLQSLSREPFYRVAHARVYLESRDVSEVDMWRWRMMYGTDIDNDLNMRGRVVIPSFDAMGKINYFVGRACWEPEGEGFFMTYKQPKGVKKWQIIFNELDVNWNKPVVLVEGVFDAIRLPNSIPMLGKSLNPHWRLFQRIVEEDAQVTLMLDGDAAADQFEIAASLKSHGVTDVRCIWLPEEMDPGSLNRTELADYLQQAEPFKQAAELTFAERILHGKASAQKEASERDAGWYLEAFEESSSKDETS